MMRFTTSPLIPLLILESTVLIERAGCQSRISTMCCFLLIPELILKYICVDVRVTSNVVFCF